MEEPITGYKQLIVWQKGIQFAHLVINATDLAKTGKPHYRLIDQLEAAATSVPMNIAEGRGRSSKKDFIHFLTISRGSLYETLTLLQIFADRGWISFEKYAEIENLGTEVAKLINGLITRLRSDLKSNP